MKNIVVVLALLLIITSCKQENSNSYVINGKAEGVYNGVRVYLKTVSDEGREMFKDTAIVMDGKFKMTGSIEEPSVHFFAIDGSLGNAIFMLENSEIDVEINKEKMMLTKVSGTESNIDCQQYQKDIDDLMMENNKALTEYRGALVAKDLSKKDSLAGVLKDIGIKVKAYPLVFAKKYNDSYFSLNLIGLESNKPKFDVVGFMEAYDNLTQRLKETKMGGKVKQRLDQLYEDYQKIAHLEVGKVAPSFEAPTPEGEMLSLDKVKGKVTIIDFWAAWCGPCRRENPNVVKVYETYHDQGLEIIGVSLDGDRRQQNPKKAWLGAIEKDGLTWHHVSNLKYFDDPVAQLYNIQSIPATFILDEEGKIVAKNLRGKALENKVKELLEKS